MRQNIRTGIRSLRNTPAFAVTAVLTLALGIGLATAVFTVADAILIRRLPVRDQDRVVVLSGESVERGIDNVPLSLEDAHVFARRTRALERTAIFLYNGAAPVTIRDGDRVSRLERALVSGDFFDVLGVRAQLGRGLRADDDVTGAAPVIVLSDRAWRQQFSGRPDIVGRRVITHEDGVSYTIVGVMPPGLDFPRGTDAWVTVHAAIPPRSFGVLSFDVIGRLARGASAADARNEMTLHFQRAGTSDWLRAVRGAVKPLPTLMVGDTGAAVLAFSAAAGLLLLITCINVANLLLVRGLSRARDIAIRTALGASQGRIVGQLLGENALLAAGGGVLGLAVAATAVRVFVALAPDGVPRLSEIGLNGVALAGSLGITMIATMLFAVVPAFMASRVDIREALGSGSRHSGSRRSQTLTEILVAGQIALSLLVLSAAGLIGRSLMKLERVDIAFHPSSVTIAELSFRFDRAVTEAQQAAQLERLVTTLQALPGVRGASPVVSVPYASTRSWEGRPAKEGQSEQDAARNPMIDIEVVSPGFFDALGLPIVRGRGFSNTDRETTSPVVMLSQSAARDYWPDADPIGKRLVGGSEHPVTVIGIVPDTRYRNLREPHATIYFPLRQSFFPFAPTTLVIRSERTPADLTALLRQTIAASAPDIALASATPFESLIAGPLSQPRMNALLLSVFALASLALAGVGVFGVLATMVRQRRRELGIRMALGATPMNVASLVLSRGFRLAIAGAAAGLAGALVTNRLLVTLLFGVSPTDVVTLAAGALVALVVAMAMSVIPARTSARIEPVVALRAD